MQVIVSNQILHAAAKENSRYAINGFCVHKTGVLSATDGRMLAIRRQVQDGSGADRYPSTDPIKKTIVPREIMPNATKKPKTVKIEVDGTECAATPVVEAKNRITDSGVKVSGQAVEGTFPPVVDIFPGPDTRDKYEMVSFNPAMLAKLAQAVEDPENGMITLCVRKDSPLKPMIVIGHGEQGGVGMLMPVNGDADTYTERFENAVKLGRMAE